MTDSEIEVIKEQIKVANHRISDLEETTKRIESLTLSVEKLAMSVETMTKAQESDRKEQNQLASRILAVEQAPLKKDSEKLDKIMETILTLVLGAVVGFLLQSFFGI